MSKFDRLPDFEAEITFLTPEQRGRSTPVSSGYRPHIHYEGADADWIILLEWDSEVPIYPGETVLAHCNLLSPWYHRDYLEEGSLFLVREGAKVVAKAKVTEILFLQDNAEENKEWLIKNDIELACEHPPKKVEK